MANPTVTSIRSVEEAVAAVVEGAQIYHAGVFLSDKKMIARGGERTRQAVRYIDENSPTGREVLIPLLHHADDGVRVIAASDLIDGWPDLAIPVIEEIQATCVTEAYRTAMGIMICKEVFGFFDFGVTPDPRFPDADRDAKRSRKPSS